MYYNSFSFLIFFYIQAKIIFTYTNSLAQLNNKLGKLVKRYSHLFYDIKVIKQLMTYWFKKALDQLYLKTNHVVR